MLPFVHLLQFRRTRPYIRLAHYNDDPLEVPSRYIPDHEFILVLKGRGWIITDAGKFPYRENSLILIPPGVVHSFVDEEPATYGHAHLAIHYDWERVYEHSGIRIVGRTAGLLEKAEPGLEAADIGSLWLPDAAAVDSVSDELALRMRKIVAAFQGSLPFRQVELEIGFLSFVKALAESLSSGEHAVRLLTEHSANRRRGAKEREEITRYILELHQSVNRTPSDPIAEREAAFANYSTAHFHRLFKEQTGTAPREYEIKLRMEKAALLLLTTNASVQDIAFECGYSDAKYFGRLFKKNERVSPTEYRSGYGNATHVEKEVLPK